MLLYLENSLVVHYKINNLNMQLCSFKNYTIIFLTDLECTNTRNLVQKCSDMPPPVFQLPPKPV